MGGRDKRIKGHWQGRRRVVIPHCSSGGRMAGCQGTREGARVL